VGGHQSINNNALETKLMAIRGGQHTRLGPWVSMVCTIKAGVKVTVHQLCRLLQVISRPPDGKGGTSDLQPGKTPPFEQAQDGGTPAAWARQGRW
jgi:hypothetical protein